MSKGGDQRIPLFLINVQSNFKYQMDFQSIGLFCFFQLAEFVEQLDKYRQKNIFPFPNAL